MACIETKDFPKRSRIGEPRSISEKQIKILTFLIFHKKEYKWNRKLWRVNPFLPSKYYIQIFLIPQDYHFIYLYLYVESSPYTVFGRHSEPSNLSPCPGFLALCRHANVSVRLKEDIWYDWQRSEDEKGKRQLSPSTLEMRNPNFTTPRPHIEHKQHSFEQNSQHL